MLFAKEIHTPPKNIMVLHGEWQLWKWGKPFDSRLFTEMSSQNDLDLRITFEFMGLESVAEGSYPKETIDHILYKIKNTPLDLVIAVLPRANEFLLTYGHKVFPEIPKIFALPAGSTIKKINKLPDAIVIPSSSDIAIKNNFERILSILPDTNELVVICGNSKHDLSYLNRTKEIIANSDKKLKVTYLVGEPLTKLLSKVSKLPKNAAILFLTYDEDINKKKIVAAIAVSQISKNASVPVFGFYDSLLGRGIVGGNLTSAEQYAKKTAEIGLQLLREEQVSSIESVKDVTIDIYDWRQLKRWNISERRLPLKNIIRYKTETLWETYKTKIILAFLFICFQTILIYVLIITVKRQYKAEKALQKAHDSLEQRVQKRTISLKEANSNLQIESKERKKALEGREKLLVALQESLDNVKTLSGLVPICSNCKKIRDDKGYWNQIESHIQKHTYAKFSHGICPKCSDELYSNEDWYVAMKKKKDV